MEPITTTEQLVDLRRAIREAEKTLNKIAQKGSPANVERTVEREIEIARLEYKISRLTDAYRTKLIDYVSSEEAIELPGEAE